MNEARKSSRQGLHTLGSILILLGFMTILTVLFAPILLAQTPFFHFKYFYVVGILGALLLIIFGAIISEKARGKAKVNGFLLRGDEIDKSEETEHRVTLEEMVKKKLITKEESQKYLNELTKK